MLGQVGHRGLLGGITAVCVARAVLPWRRVMAALLLAWLTVAAVHAAAPDMLAPYRAVRGVPVSLGNDRSGMQKLATLAQDADGHIWLSSYDGYLARMEGGHTRFYATADIPGLEKSVTARALLPLPDGDMLVGFGRGGLFRWERDEDRFVAMDVSDGTVLSRINELRAGNKGTVWISAEEGLFRWSGRAGAPVEPVSHSLQASSQSSRVFSTLERADGSLWVATSRGAFVRAPNGKQFTPLATGNAVLDARVADETVWTLSEDPHGRVWLGLVRSGVVVVDKEGRSFAPSGMDSAEALHKGRTIRTMVWHNGRMWLGVDGGGMFGCADPCRTVEPVPVNLPVFEGRQIFLVHGLMVERGGRMWAASSHGAFHFAPSLEVSTDLDTTPPVAEGRQQFNAVRSMLVDSRNRLWMGTSTGQVQVYDLRDGSRHLVTLPEAVTDVVWSLREDGQGRVWVTSRGVSWVDMDTLKATLAGEVGRKFQQRMFSVALGPDRAWLGDHDGIFEVALDGTVLRRLEGTVASGLLSSQVNALAYVDGRLWAATPGGLHRVDLQRWRAAVVKPTNLDKNSADATPFVSALFPDGETLWVGTAAGLWKVGGKDWWAERVAGTERMDITSVVTDAQGEVWWLAEDGQAYRLDSAGKVSAFGPRDGIQASNGYPRQSGARAPDGSVLFGTHIGALNLSTALMAANKPKPVELTPQITRLSVDGEALPKEALPDGTRPLVLAADHDRISVEFSAPDYIARDAQRYAYQMEGYDRRWVELGSGSSPVATYSRLPAGDYTLLLKAATDEVPGKEWIVRVPIQVQPNWYERAGVRIAATVVGFSVLLLWLQLRDRTAHRRRQRLEELVRQRTQDLEQANRQLEQLAGEDALTGLYNRRRAFQRLSEIRAEAKRHARNDTLVLLDLDYFKHVNDTHGHQAGDDVLREVGRRLKATLRGVDIAARYGGEEFLLVLVQTSLEDAVEAVMRVRDAIRGTPMATVAGDLLVTASIGVAGALEDETVEQWVARADAALYRSKNEGRDRISVAPAYR